MNILQMFIKPRGLEEKWIIKEERMFRRNFFNYMKKEMSNGDIELWAYSVNGDVQHYLGLIKNGLWHQPADLNRMDYSMERYARIAAESLSKGIYDVREFIHRKDLQSYN